ncbi:MAG: HU family DNA-binding protein [Rickettsiaceae bacterium]|nr:HU family DNA-binding protein [Rickettsiaceae bacterium]
MSANIDKLAKQLHTECMDELSLEDTKFACYCIFEAIKTELIAGGRIEIRNFGSFSIRMRKVPKDPRKIATSSRDQRKDSKSIYFRMSQSLKVE